tara:strand:+ start:381 stop:1112 length:732 start_codon:yes stop_codon:yes gene_type:complete
MDVLTNPKYSYLLGKQPFYYKIWKTIFYFYSKIVFSTYAPLKVYGRDKIPNSSYIFTSNHNSHMDVALLSAAAGKSFNHFGMLAAKDYWFDSWVKLTLVNTVMNLIPIDRKIDGIREFPIEDTLKLCNSFMDFSKRNLVIFPEGTRGTPGVILPFQKGPAIFSLKLKKPILPAVIFGSHKIWPKEKIFFSWPTQITVYILDPIYPDSFIGKDNPNKEEINKAINNMTSALEKIIKEKARILYD